MSIHSFHLTICYFNKLFLFSIGLIILDLLSSSLTQDQNQYASIKKIIIKISCSGTGLSPSLAITSGISAFFMWSYSSTRLTSLPLCSSILYKTHSLCFTWDFYAKFSSWSCRPYSQLTIPTSGTSKLPV